MGNPINDLAAAIAGKDPHGTPGTDIPVTYRIGTVTAVSVGPPASVTVQFGSMTPVECGRLAGVTYTVGKKVACHVIGTQVLALGCLY